MAAKKTSSKNTKFSFSWMKLLVGLSLSFNLATIVFLITLFKTTYFDLSLTSMMVGRDFDQNGCFVIVPKTSDGTKDCFVYYRKDANQKIVSPEFLQGKQAPKFPEDY